MLKVIVETLIGEDQNGFRSSRSTVANVFILQQIFEKRRGFNPQTHVAFVDFEEEFDQVNRNKLWTVKQRRGYPQHLINVVRNLHCNSKIIVNTGKKKTEDILGNKGVRQGCSNSPTLLNIYIDDIPSKETNY